MKNENAANKEQKSKQQIISNGESLEGNTKQITQMLCGFALDQISQNVPLNTEMTNNFWHWETAVMIDLHKYSKK